MAVVDLITALGRLLHDGALRDAFTADPAAAMRQIGLCARDQPAFLHLVPAELEFQARVLLRKRFELVRRALPRTCCSIGQDAWLEFLRYGRSNRPAANDVTRDSLGFCQHLSQARPHSVCPLELNRSRFCQEGRRMALRGFLRMPFRQRRVPGLQILWRRPSGRAHEWRISFGG